MQFRAVTKALVILLATVCATDVALSQQAVQSSAILVSSPDGKYQAFWVDLTTTQHSAARRLIFVVDAASNELLFTHCTFQRRTGAAWNNSSTACAIFDAPDNANIYLWMLTKDSSSPAGGWSVRQIDVEKMAAQMMPDIFLEKTVRMGVEKVSWESDETLNAQFLLNGRSLTINLPAREHGNGPR